MIWKQKRLRYHSSLTFKIIACYESIYLKNYEWMTKHLFFNVVLRKGKFFKGVLNVSS
jgi:hypothetical protein